MRGLSHLSGRVVKFANSSRRFAAAFDDNPSIPKLCGPGQVCVDDTPTVSYDKVYVSDQCCAISLLLHAFFRY
jgi:hypothetical protein